jgi:RNA polymerase sigma-70 factor (ECF subfamily)
MKQEIDILIGDLKQRKASACRQLLSDYGPTVLRMVSRIVTRREDAEEVYQDVFMKALRGIAGYKPQQSSLKTWLSRIAYNESLNFVRGKRNAFVYRDDLGIDTQEEPDEALYNEETIAQLEQALGMLPPHEQAIIHMYYYDNMSLADIAFVTGSIPSTVGSQLSRIRKKLYRMIKTR